MKVIVLTNPAAGAKADEAAELIAALRAVGVEAQVRAFAAQALTNAARAAAAEETDAVVAAGGDGTVSAVAQGLVGSNKPLGILPSGTLNHFARDLGLPLTLTDAAAVIASGERRHVDVADLNGRTFINNSSIGIYPQIVHHRERQRQRLGRNKWIAMLIACFSVFRRHPAVRVRMGIGSRTVLRTTPFVFVGNNRYEMSLQMMGKRTKLDGGELCLYFVNRSGRFALLMLAIRAALGRLEQARDFEMMDVREVWIETPRRDVRVALDGEVTRMTPPLHYTIRPAALTVVAPPA